MYKPYVKYTFEKKGTVKVLTREFDEVATIDEAMAQFSKSDWLIRRSGYPSTKNLRLCIQQMDVAPEVIGRTQSGVLFGNGYPDLDQLKLSEYIMTIRYVRKGVIEPTANDIGEEIVKKFAYEGEVVDFFATNKDEVRMLLGSIAQSGDVDFPTLCIYYPTNTAEPRKPKGKSLLKEPKVEQLLI